MTDPVISFFVPGIPAPGGSKRAFVGHRKDGSHYANVVDAGGERTKNWRANVALCAAEALSGRGILFGRDVPFILQIRFVMPRPQTHYGSMRGASYLKPSAPRYHTSKPDATKLLRSTEDALTLYEMEPRVSRSQEKRIAIESGALFVEVKNG